MISIEGYVLNKHRPRLKEDGSIFFLATLSKNNTDLCNLTYQKGVISLECELEMTEEQKEDMLKTVSLIKGELGTRLKVGSCIDKSSQDYKSAMLCICKILFILRKYHVHAKSLSERTGDKTYYFLGEYSPSLADCYEDVEVRIGGTSTDISDYETALNYVNAKTSIKVYGGVLLKGKFEFNLTAKEYAQMYTEYTN